LFLLCKFDKNKKGVPSVGTLHRYVHELLRVMDHQGVEFPALDVLGISKRVLGMLGMPEGELNI
jgi:hypothetical protein